MNVIIEKVTQEIINRSKKSRKIYLDRMKEVQDSKVHLACSNIAHAIAPMNEKEKESLGDKHNPNLAIITAYNDMLSAHEPYKDYPDLIKKVALENLCTAQVAGGVPAMCDGVTQGQKGMELSLFSRDNIAMGTAIGLSHNIYDGAVYLGVCDKIVPGLLIGALSFGYLPGIFIPTGPMRSGISNSQKAKVRQDFAQGRVDEKELLSAETQSYHSCGTCTFFGTANSNQMLLEMMGLQLPNSSFINVNTPLRDALTTYAIDSLVKKMKKKQSLSLSQILDEKSFVNAIVGLMATGGSTNHTIHLIAMARAAGIILTWDDFDAISKAVPLLCKMYPNGSADVNHFRDAGGMGVVIAQLLEAGLVHNDVNTVVGFGLENYAVQPKYDGEKVIFEKSELVSKNINIISSVQNPFDAQGGIRLLKGNMGESIVKTSALKEEHFKITAPAVVFESQEELQAAFKDDKLNCDFIAVVRYQGPKANGMPELHALLPVLGALQDKGYKVALITDGRMSGASGKVPSAIHLTPEAKDNGVISKIQNEDMIVMDIENGILDLRVTKEILDERIIKKPHLKQYGSGTELFSSIRSSVNQANEGATIFTLPGEEI